MTEERLPAIEIETAHAPDASVIWMHGLVATCSIALTILTAVTASR